MAVRKEMVLYYTPEKTSDDQKRKGVLVRLGIRIRNIAPEQAGQQGEGGGDLAFVQAHKAALFGNVFL